MDSGGAGRCRVLRRGTAAIPGGEHVVLYRGGAPDALAEAGSGAGSGVAGPGCDLLGGGGSTATIGLGSRPTLRRSPRRNPREEALAGAEAVGRARLHLPNLRDPSA